MIDYLISKKNQELLKKAEETNSEEMLTWKLPNLVYPIGVILISMLCFLLFKKSEQVTLYAFLNLMLNGSLPMVALNRLSSLGVNIFKFDKEGENRKSQTNTYSLRVILHYYSLGLVLSIIIFYVFQVINTPFNIWWSILIQIILAIICVYQSLKVSKYGYLLQEKLMERTLGDDIKENALETKKHLTAKYE